MNRIRAYYVAIPFEVGQVSTNGERIHFRSKDRVAIPFEVGQVSTWVSDAGKRILKAMSQSLLK